MYFDSCIFFYSAIRQRLIGYLRLFFITTILGYWFLVLLIYVFFVVYTSLDHCVLKSIENISEHQTEMSILAKLLENKQMPLEKKRYFVNLLLEFGGDPNLEKPGKDSCLMLAVHHGDPTMVKTLLQAQADINHKGNKGYTALHVFFLNINKSGIYNLIP